MHFVVVDLLQFKYFVNFTGKSFLSPFLGCPSSHWFKFANPQNVQNLSLKKDWKRSLKVLEKSLLSQCVTYKPVGTLFAVEAHSGVGGGENLFDIVGNERFYYDMSMMLGYKPCAWWGICWRFITPVLIAVTNTAVFSDIITHSKHVYFTFWHQSTVCSTQGLCGRKPGPKFTDNLRKIFKTIFGLTTILWQLANSQNIYDNLKTYLKTKYYDHLVDVLRQLGSNSQILS